MGYVLELLDNVLGDRFQSSDDVPRSLSIVHDDLESECIYMMHPITISIIMYL